MVDAEKQKKKRLSREDVIVEAIALADEEGLDAVSMRALATRLSVVPMAMYKHVSDKTDLVNAMIEHVVAGFAHHAPTNSSHSWRERFLMRIRQATRTLDAHPWLRQALETSSKPGPNALTHMNNLAGDLISGGMSVDLTHYAMHAIGSRIWGFNPEAFQGPQSKESSTEQVSPEQLTYMQQNFPHVTAIALDAATRNPDGACNTTKEFDFILNLLLDSFERLRDAEWVSSGPTT